MKERKEGRKEVKKNRFRQKLKKKSDERRNKHQTIN